MKFLCLSYIDESKFAILSESERDSFVKKCAAYDDTLRKGGHFIRLEALGSAPSAKTLRSRNGKVSVVDGPFAETKEQIGGILLLEAHDLTEATELMAKHPGIQVATFEIRALDEESTARVNPAE